MFCKCCISRETCKQICVELEKSLPKDYTGKEKRRGKYIFKEYSHTPEKLEEIATSKAFQLKFGRKTKKDTDD